MRIAFVTLGGLTRCSGGDHYDHQVIEALRRGGDTVDVIAIPDAGYGRSLAQNFSRPTSYDWQVHAQACDVIIQDELAHPALFWRNRRWSRSRPPIIALVHNLTCRQPATRFRPLVFACEWAYLRSVDGVVGVCQSTAADVRATGGARALI